MAERAETKKSKLVRWIFLVILVIGLPAGGWAVWSYMLFSPQDDDLVVLRADPTPFRVKPAEGTQANVPNQDSTFMGLIDGNSKDNTTSEVIALSGPAPEPPPVPLTPPASDTTTDKVAVPADGADPSGQPDSSSQVVATAPQDVSSQGPENSATQASANDQDNNTNASVSDGQTADQPTDLTRSLSLPDAPKPRPAGAKDRQDWMMVQLAAFREEDKARTAAALLNEKHKARMSGYTLGVSSVTSTDGQLFWRVITDALPKQDALQVCEELKRSGQDCILRQQKEQSP